METTYGTMRRQLISFAEHALRAWFGEDLTREQAAEELTKWRNFKAYDEGMVAELLAMFPTAEPVMKPGVDFYPELPVPGNRWSAYAMCPRCKSLQHEPCTSDTHLSGEFLAEPHAERRQVTA